MKITFKEIIVSYTSSVGYICQFFLCSLPFVNFTVGIYISNLFVCFAQSNSSFQTVKFKLCSIKIWKQCRSYFTIWIIKFSLFFFFFLNRQMMQKQSRLEWLSTKSCYCYLYILKEFEKLVITPSVPLCLSCLKSQIF